MDDILENPAWHALNTGNKHMALGEGDIRFFPEDIAPFVGMKEVTADNYDHLYDQISFGRVVAVVAPFEVDIPGQWKVVRKMLGFQMIYTDPALPDTSLPIEWVPLTLQHVPDMLALTALTKPGPFLTRTIEFGSYFGIFSTGRLVSMAGYRLAVGRYREISAVCTHPDHLGHGYAGMLIRHLMRLILDQDETPILHVLQTNTGAIKLYEKLGFRVARDMRFDMIAKK